MKLCLLLFAAGCLANVDGSAGDRDHAHVTGGARGLYGLNVPADGSLTETAADLAPAWVRVELVDGIDAAPVIDAYHGRGIAVLLLVGAAVLV